VENRDAGGLHRVRLDGWARREGVNRNTEHVFGLRVPREVPVRQAPREHLRFEWLSWREAADRCFSPSNAEAILHLPHFPS
jgi:dATP pyrophosphohydrolase